MENKLKAYHTMQANDKIDTYLANEMLGFPAEMRTYETPLAILEDLHVSKIDLLSNNPDKFEAFMDKISVVTPLEGKPNKHNAKYLTAKRHRENLRRSPQQEQLRRSPGDGSSDLSNQKPEEGSKEDLLSRLQKEVPLDLPPISVIERLRIGVVRTRWNATLVDSLFEGCKTALLDAKVQSANILEHIVPGAYELPFAAKVGYIISVVSINLVTSTAHGEIWNCRRGYLLRCLGERTDRALQVYFSSCITGLNESTTANRNSCYLWR